jgi:transposase
LDLGAKKTAFCEVASGQVVRRVTVSDVNSLQGLLGPGQPAARVAVEACREAWHVHAILTEWGNEVLLVDTTRSKQLGIGHHGRKTDRIDAEVLAFAVERGSIPLAHLLSPGRRELRRQIGIRRSLVEARANLVVTMRGLGRELGERLPSCPVEAFAKRVRASAASEALKALLQPQLTTLETVNMQLQEVEQKLGQLCVAEPKIRLLCTAPGVGPLVAAAFVSVVDDAGRFRNAHQLESYLGLVPGEDSSGGRRRIGSITKRGNRYLRAVLVESAWVILRKKDNGDPLIRWAKDVSSRRGKNVAVVAVARRLAGILWAMWKNDTVFDAERLRARSIVGLERQAQDTQLRANALKRASRKTTGKMTLREIAM